MEGFAHGLSLLDQRDRPLLSFTPFSIMANGIAGKVMVSKLHKQRTMTSFIKTDLLVINYQVKKSLHTFHMWTLVLACIQLGSFLWMIAKAISMSKLFLNTEISLNRRKLPPANLLFTHLPKELKWFNLGN